MQKIIKKFLYLFMVYAISSSFGCSSSKDKKTAAVAVSPRVAWFMGEVHAERAGEKRNLELGDTLSSEDTIVTGKNGNIEIMIGESGVLKIAKNTKLSVESLLAEEGNSDTRVNLDYGKVVSVVKKEKKDSNFTVVTPTTIAGVRGTAFLTSVEKPGGKSESCQTDCVVEFSVIEGSIGIRKNGSDEEVILEKNTRATIKQNTKFNKSMVRPLNRESLDKLKDMIVFHKNDVMGYSRLIDDLRSSSAELRQFEVVNSSDEKARMSKRESIQSTDEVTKTAETSESKYVKKNDNKEYLKIKAEEDKTFK